MKIYCNRTNRDKINSLIGEDLWVYAWTFEYGYVWYKILRKSRNKSLVVNIAHPIYTAVNLGGVDDFSESNRSCTSEELNRILDKEILIKSSDLLLYEPVETRATDELFKIEDY